jgi:predicted type IV restriction endonuclease
MQEAYSRVIIDRKLREAGWNIEDPAQVVFEDHGEAGRVGMTNISFKDP